VIFFNRFIDNNVVSVVFQCLECKHVCIEIMLLIIKPILMRFITSEPVKKMIVELLEKLAGLTENKLDDLAVKTVREALLPE
jgi:hypothetical protein